MKVPVPMVPPGGGSIVGVIAAVLAVAFVAFAVKQALNTPNDPFKQRQQPM